MITREYSLWVEDVISIVTTGFPHHLHPLVHDGLVALHVDIKSHGFRPGSSRSTRFPVVRSDGDVVILDCLPCTSPGWGEDDILLGSTTAEEEATRVE